MRAVSPYCSAAHEGFATQYWHGGPATGVSQLIPSMSAQVPHERQQSRKKHKHRKAGSDENPSPAFNEDERGNTTGHKRNAIAVREVQWMTGWVGWVTKRTETDARSELRIHGTCAQREVRSEVLMG